MLFDFHTHDTRCAPGSAIVNLPATVLADPRRFCPQPGALYSAGIHPWWTSAPAAEICSFIEGLELLIASPQVVRVGECGLDKLRGAPLERQVEIFRAQVRLSETFHKPMTLHCVRAYDVLLHEHKALRPTQEWTIHGFRGGVALAQQLLAAGFSLSFGPQRNAAAWALTPPQQRYEESDAEAPIEPASP